MIRKLPIKWKNLKAMDIACDAVIILGERYHKLALEMAEKEADPVLVKKELNRSRPTWKLYRLTNRRPSGRQSSYTGLHILRLQQN